MFSIADLKFDAVAAGNSLLTFGFGYGSYNYSGQYVGHLKGGDGILFTADDVLITSGANTQQVDGLVGRGSGNANAAYCPGCNTAQQQAAIQTAIDEMGGMTSFTGTYTLTGQEVVSGSDTVNFTPEPGTWILFGTGLAALFGRKLRTTSKAIPPTVA